MDFESTREDLRKLNYNTTRTDVENLFLREMVEADRDDLLKESTDLDMVIPGNTVGLFGDGSSEDFEDTLRADDFNPESIF